MRLKKLALLAAAGTTLLAAAPAFAHPPQWAPAHGWRTQVHHSHRHPHYYRLPDYAYYPVPPVVIAPPPYYYAPPPRPVIYGRIPVNPNLRVDFGVRF